MASKALPQALLTIPRNPNQPSPKKLGFSTVSLRSFSFNATLVSNSMVPVTSGASKLNRIGSGRDKRSFIVRSEADSEAEVESVENVEEIEAVDDGVVDAVDGAEVTDAEAEVENPPRKPRIKLGDIMGILNRRAVEASEKERPIPDIRTGDIVEIKLEVPENRRRASIYKGIVISRQNAGIHTTIRVRRIIAGVGVEIVFPLYSPNIKELKVVKHRKVRRARLYYLRDKLPRLSTFK